LALTLGLMTACGDDTSAAAVGPCDVTPAAITGCGASCDPNVAVSVCQAGLFCGEKGSCTAQCSADPSLGFGCSGGAICGADGRCPPGSTPVGGGNSGGGSNVCAEVEVETEAVIPTVVMVIDQSGSMNANFGGSNRWEAVCDTLMAQPGGLIDAMQGQVRFGLALYSGASTGGSNNLPIDPWPDVTYVAPALDNYTAIDAQYICNVNQVKEDTPTGESLDAVRGQLVLDPVATAGPMVFIIATDGEPDHSTNPDPSAGAEQAATNQLTVEAAQRAFQAGIQSFIISVGSGAISAAHLNEMANVGIGLPAATTPPAPSFEPNNAAELQTVLQSLVTQQLSCELTLNGTIDDFSQACSGEVTLSPPGSSRTLGCNDPQDGWEVIDASRIRLLGQACTDFLNLTGTSVQASFPCGVATAGLI
ncbi:MAG: vWA domain-containing protein, partial [Polyangiales bacterium]